MTREGIAKHTVFANFAALAIHEMNAISWREWRLFGFTDDRVGEIVFTGVHFPIYFILLATCTRLSTKLGQYVSLTLSTFLVVHLFLHWDARSEGYFTDTFGFGVVVLVAATALAQLLATVTVMRAPSRR